MPQRPSRSPYGLCSVSFLAVNVEQAEDWNGASGREFIEQMLGRLRARLLAAAQIEDGENVLDIGPSCGEMTILAARAAGSGHALGADLSPDPGSRSAAARGCCWRR
jgi:hypothetical protein